MRPSKSSGPGLTFKEKVEIAQAIVTIAAVFIGGLWTYNVFIKERRVYPHVNIEQKIFHVALSDQINLLRVGLDLTNTGNSLMVTGKSTLRVQQILPWLPCPKDGPCAANEVSEAIVKIKRQGDRFSWPLIAERDVYFAPIVDIEPGEKQTLDFEFVMPSDVSVVRIYAYFRNEQKFKEGREIGWEVSSYYDFHSENRGDAK